MTNFWMVSNPAQRAHADRRFGRRACLPGSRLWVYVSPEFPEEILAFLTILPGTHLPIAHGGVTTYPGHLIGFDAVPAAQRPEVLQAILAPLLKEAPFERLVFAEALRDADWRIAVLRANGWTPASSLIPHRLENSPRFTRWRQRGARSTGAPGLMPYPWPAAVIREVKRVLLESQLINPVDFDRLAKGDTSFWAITSAGSTGLESVLIASPGGRNQLLIHAMWIARDAPFAMWPLFARIAQLSSRCPETELEMSVFKSNARMRRMLKQLGAEAGETRHVMHWMAAH